VIESPSASVYISVQCSLEEMMETAVARLRAKTDRELVVIIRKEFDRTASLAARGHYVEAAQSADLVRALLSVANIPAQERERIQRLLDRPATACA
jgi:DNA-binding LacI/PurR family transcriptional regulator